MRLAPILLCAAILCYGQVWPFLGPGGRSANSGGGDGPNTWYYPGALGESSFTTGPTAGGWEPQSHVYGSAVTISSNGTATKLAFRGITYGGGGSFKIGLYDSGGTLLAQTTITGVSETPSWWEGTINQPVTAGTHYILVSSATSSGSYYYNTTINGSFASTVYASAMAGSVTIDTDTGYGYAVRVYVD